LGTKEKCIIVSKHSFDQVLREKRQFIQTDYAFQVAQPQSKKLAGSCQKLIANHQLPEARSLVAKKVSNFDKKLSHAHHRSRPTSNQTENR